MKIAVIGKITDEKEWLIYYLAKVISGKSSVFVVTPNQDFIDDLDVFEYDSNLWIGKSLPEDEIFDYTLLNLESDDDNIYDKTIFYSGIRKEEMDHNEQILKEYKGHNSSFLLLNGLLYDSPISYKYLVKRLGLSPKDQEIITIMFHDSDLSLMVENQYNERIHIKSLSKAYHKSLNSMIGLILDLNQKEIRQLFKVAARSK